MSEILRLDFVSGHGEVMPVGLCDEVVKGGSLSLEVASFDGGHFPSVQARGAAVEFVLSHSVYVVGDVGDFFAVGDLSCSGLGNGGFDVAVLLQCCSHGTVSFGVVENVGFVGELGFSSQCRVICGWAQCLTSFCFLFLFLLLLFTFICGSRFIITVFTPLVI